MPQPTMTPYSGPATSICSGGGFLWNGGGTKICSMLATNVRGDTEGEMGGWFGFRVVKQVAGGKQVKRLFHMVSVRSRALNGTADLGGWLGGVPRAASWPSICKTRGLGC